jgi:hypothetical protein
VENAEEVQHQLRLMHSQQEFQTQWEREPPLDVPNRASTRARLGLDDDKPPKRARHDSDDESPPRRGPSREHSSPGRSRLARHASEDDESPVRRVAPQPSSDSCPPKAGSQALRVRHDSDDESPPRRGPSRGHSSPGRSRPARHASEDDESPVRRVAHNSADRESKSEAAPARAPIGGLLQAHEMSAQIREERERCVESFTIFHLFLGINTVA